MKIGFVVNEIETELELYTTTSLALAATQRGHQIWYIGLSDFIYDPDEQVDAWARRPRDKSYRSVRTFLKDIQSNDRKPERISIESLDVLMLRHDPAEDVLARPWARLVGINFGRLATRGGVIVLNDPDGLSRAINKMYLQLFPESVRPRTLISKNKAEIRNFAKQQGGSVVLKPLAGSGGRNVFLVTPDEQGNLNQMIESVMNEGYVIAQEYLPKAVDGDTRLFMMNGHILEHKGAVAAVHRVRSGGDIRSNITAGGKAVLAKIDDDMIKIAETVRPRLVQDGMFLVGLDIVGDKLMEINVFSPGALELASRLVDVNFSRIIVEALERKVDYARDHRHQFSNIEMATL